MASLFADIDRKRLTAFLLVAGLHVLLALLLLMLAPPVPKDKSEPSVFTMLPDLRPAPKPAPRAKRTAGAKAKPTPAKAVAEKPPVQPPAPPELFGVQLFEGVDISKLPNRRAELAGAGDAAEGPGRDSDTAYGPGEGPGGARLYNAEWQREPTHAELAFYLPRGAPTGSWALIACQTIDRNRVEDCRELGESPPGSGLSRAMVNAAWQFRVKPPRIGGKPVIGSWVRIRFDFSQKDEG